MKKGASAGTLGDEGERPGNGGAVRLLDETGLLVLDADTS